MSVELLLMFVLGNSSHLRNQWDHFLLFQMKMLSNISYRIYFFVEMKLHDFSQSMCVMFVGILPLFLSFYKIKLDIISFQRTRVVKFWCRRHYVYQYNAPNGGETQWKFPFAINEWEMYRRALRGERPGADVAANRRKILWALFTICHKQLVNEDKACSLFSVLLFRCMNKNTRRMDFVFCFFVVSQYVVFTGAGC